MSKHTKIYILHEKSQLIPIKNICKAFSIITFLLKLYKGFNLLRFKKTSNQQSEPDKYNLISIHKKILTLCLNNFDNKNI